MANLKNWHPDMTSDERAWFDACPKAVLFEMARQFAICLCGNEDAEKAFEKMRDEWAILHANHIVPQKPFNVEKGRTQREAFEAQIAAIRAAGD